MNIPVARLLAVVWLVLLVAACGGDDGAGPGPAASATVSMPGFSFTPFTTTLSIGGSVIYDFPAEPHNVIFAVVTGAPTDIQQTTNRQVTRAFPVAGTFPYDCTIHPGMSGVVIVR